MDDLTKPLDEKNIKVTMNDFLSALQEIIPAFGASTDDLQRYSGKTAMAVTIGIDSDFSYAKIVSAVSMIGLSESSKCAKISKVFEDAYMSPLKIIILDGIERLLEYVPIGPCFSNLVAQTLLALLKKLPPKGKNMLVIGTTSEVGFLETIGICAAFSFFYHVPTLFKADARKVLEGLNVFARDDIDAAAEALDGVMTIGQRVLFEFLGTNYIFTVNQAMVEDQEKSNAIERGIITNDTYIVFEAVSSSGIKIINQREAASSNIFKQKEFDLHKLGIGGVSDEFLQIFRRAFASRVFPPHVTKKLGIKYVKGMLLYGPPGTGKTLMARQIGKLLNGREPKIVNGPDVLSKYIGESEKNVRDLFADAEQDQRTRGDQSDLHVIIFDEIDAICKARGSTRDGTGVHDGIVNQLLTKIDGVESLNNVLLIGMTNRKDLIDEALLRPGRLEVLVEINLPDENGRLQILQIHTNRMKENSFLAADVNLQELAARTKNFSGAELEGVVKSAVSFALNRQISMDDLTKPLDEENIKVTMNDFLSALQEIIPAFGASADDLQRCRVNGMVDCGETHKHIYERTMLLVEEVKMSRVDPLVSCLLGGPGGSGKTAMAATIGIDSDFPYAKIVSAESMIGLSESSKCAKIAKVFEDAYRSQLSIIILDDIERLLEYVPIGPRFSNLIAQTLLVLLKKLPPKGKNMLVIGTTSEVGFLETIGISAAFSVFYHVSTLSKADARKVLEGLNVFARDDIDAAAEALDGMPLKKLYSVVKIAANAGKGENLEAIYSGKQKIDINYFYDILSDYVSIRH